MRANSQRQARCEFLRVSRSQLRAQHQSERLRQLSDVLPLPYWPLRKWRDPERFLSHRQTSHNLARVKGFERMHLNCLGTPVVRGMSLHCCPVCFHSGDCKLGKRVYPFTEDRQQDPLAWKQARCEFLRVYSQLQAQCEPVRANSQLPAQCEFLRASHSQLRAQHQSERPRQLLDVLPLPYRP